MRRPALCALTLAALAVHAAQAKDIEVTQKDRKFSTSALDARVGDTLVFRNDDPFFHNIFSLTEGRSFDLGSFPRGESRKVKLAKEGEMEIECAIHPEMKLTVKVAR